VVNHYEFAMIIDPEDKEYKVEDVKSKVLSLIENFGGELEREEEWGRRKLAYPIKRKNEGHYTFWYIRIDGQKIKELVEKLRLIEPIMRFMFIKRDLKKEKKRREEKERYLKAMEILRKQQARQREESANSQK